MHPSPHRPTPREIIANPAIYCSVPSLFGTAWQQMKAARGQSVNFARLGDPAHQIDTPLSVTLDAARERALARIRQYMTTPPTGGDAA